MRTSTKRKTPVWAVAAVTAAGLVVGSAAIMKAVQLRRQAEAHVIHPEELLRACEKLIQQLDSEPLRA